MTTPKFIAARLPQLIEAQRLKLVNSEALDLVALRAEGSSERTRRAAREEARGRIDGLVMSLAPDVAEALLSYTRATAAQQLWSERLAALGAEVGS